MSLGNVPTRNNRAADAAIALRLQLHDKLMAQFVTAGDSRAEASRKAYKLISNASTKDVKQALAEIA